VELSTNGLAVLCGLEDLRLEPYEDAAGKLTIGYGHLLRDGETFTTITEKEAERLLEEDVEDAEEAVSDLVRVPLTQGQFDALVCFTFNVGRTHLAQSTLLKRLNGKDYKRVPLELERWVYAGGKYLTGLVNRRAKEVALWNA